jgi:hypothetical protein
MPETPQVHKIYADEFEDVRMYAHGSLIGHLAAHSQAPYMTGALKTALEIAYAIAFDAGYALAKEQADA